MEKFTGRARTAAPPPPTSPPSPPPPPLAHPPFCRPLFAAPRRPAANNRIRYVNLYISTFAHPVSLFSSLFPRPRSCQTGGDWGLRGSTANSATTGAMPRQRRRNRARRQIRKDRENGEKTARRGRKRERERERERKDFIRDIIIWRLNRQLLITSGAEQNGNDLARSLIEIVNRRSKIDP